MMRLRLAYLTWRSVRLAATAGAADQPRMLVDRGRFQIFWNTSDEGMRVLPLGDNAKDVL